MSTTKPGTRQPEGRVEGGVASVLANYGRKTGIVAALSLSFIFALGAWYALHETSSTKTSNAKIPLIKADNRPVKVKPTDPGGLKIPNQDKLVFERITPEIRPYVEEVLAPEPEEPIITSKGSIKEVAPHDSDKIMNAKINKNLKSVSTPSTKIKTSRVNANVGYRIQMAAFREKDRAQANWTKIKNTHAEILGELIPMLERVNLGRKGVYFRVQAGYFSAEVSARKACMKLKMKGQGCIIIRPK